MSDYYRPMTPFTVPMILLKPVKTTVKGVVKKTYQDREDGHLFYGSIKTYGGTEKVVNGLIAIEDTATIETWIDPAITGDCAIALADDGTMYEIIADPEDLARRHQFMQIRVRQTKGGA